MDSYHQECSSGDGHPPYLFERLNGILDEASTMGEAIFLFWCEPTVAVCAWDQRTIANAGDVGYNQVHSTREDIVTERR